MLFDAIDLLVDAMTDLHDRKRTRTMSQRENALLDRYYALVERGRESGGVFPHPRGVVVGEVRHG